MLQYNSYCKQILKVRFTIKLYNWYIWLLLNSLNKQKLSFPVDYIQMLTA